MENNIRNFDKQMLPYSVFIKILSYEWKEILEKIKYDCNFLFKNLNLLFMSLEEHVHYKYNSCYRHNY